MMMMMVVLVMMMILLRITPLLTPLATPVLPCNSLPVPSQSSQQHVFEMPWERREGARRVSKDVLVNVGSLLPQLHAELDGACVVGITCFSHVKHRGTQALVVVSLRFTLCSCAVTIFMIIFIIMIDIIVIIVIRFVIVIYHHPSPQACALVTSTVDQQ